MARRTRSSRVHYVSSEKFTNELIDAIRDDKIARLPRSATATIDILLIDDIQFIAGKEPTQEEFFHTFNDLYQTGRQIVISSDRPPRPSPAGGSPALPLRVGSDRRRPAARLRDADRDPPDEGGGRVPLPDDVADFIANKIKSNIRELEGSLVRSVAY